MKPTHYLLCSLLILFSGNMIQKGNNSAGSSSQSVRLANLNPSTLFNALFHKPSKGNWCTWKPLSSESDFPRSKEGFCHTRLDTIIRYKKDSTAMAVIVFGTVDFKDGQIASSPALSPMMSIAVAKQTTDKSWKIENFQKDFGCHGSWGVLPEMKVTKIGLSHFLEEDWGITNKGYTESWDILWHLPSFVESIKLTGSDNSGATDEESRLYERQDSLVDISEGTHTKVLVLKLESSVVNGKPQTRKTARTEYQLNESKVFEPINKQKR